MDKIIFPNGNEKILSIDFPSGEKLTFDEGLKCSSCGKEFSAGFLFDLHLEWSKQNNICNPQSIADFLHRECPYCNTVCRVLLIEANGNTGGGFMPNAGDVMKLYLVADEVAELAKQGEVIGTIVGPGEIVEFDSRTKKKEDGTPAKDKKIQICVSLNEEERFWTPNATTMRAMIAKFGQATEDWEGKQIKLEALKQSIAGQMKLVVYGTPVQ